MAREVAHILLDVHAARAHLVHAGEAPGHIAGGHKLGHARKCVVGHLAEQLAGVFHTHGAAAVHRERLERRQGVAQAAARMAGDEGQRLTVVLEALGGAHELKALGDVGVGDAVEFQTLAARKHRLGNLLRVGGAQHKHHVRRRLLQRLEQRIERRRGEHVDLVDHVHLVAALRGGKGDAVDDLVTHVVNAGTRRGVELVHIGVRAARNLLALLARAVGVGRGGTASRLAHEGLGQKTRRSGLAGTARAREEVGMSHAPVRQGVLQGRDDMLLSHHALKRLRAVLAIQRLHASSLGVRCAVLAPTSVRHSAPNSVENRWYATASACPADPLSSHKKAPPAPSASGARKAMGSDLPRALVRLAGDDVADRLDDLDEDDAQHDGDDHDVDLVALVTVADGDVAQAAGAHAARHGGIAEERDEGDGRTANERRQALLEIDLRHKLPGVGAKRLTSLHQAAVDVGQALLHHARNKGDGAHRKRHDGAGNAQRGAGDQARERDDAHKQDDEGDGAQHVHDPAEHGVEDRLGMQAVLGRDHENDAQRHAHEVGKEHRDARHHDGVAHALGHEVAVGVDKGLGNGYDLVHGLGLLHVVEHDVAAGHDGVVGEQGLRDLAARVAEDLLRGALLHDAAAVDDGDAVAGLLRHREGVGDHDHRDTEFLVDVAKQLEHAHRGAGVQGARRLVAQHDLGVVGKRAGNGDALLLTAGELAGIVALFVSQAHQLEKLARTLGAVGLRHTAMHLEGEHDVGQHRTLLEQAEVLENHTDGRAQVEQLLAAVTRDVLTVDDDATRRGALQQVDAAHKRGLARARRTDDAEDIAVVDGEVYVMQDMVRVVGALPKDLVKVFDLNHGSLFPYVLERFTSPELQRGNYTRKGARRCTPRPMS